MANRKTGILTEKEAKTTKRSVAVGGVRGLMLRVSSSGGKSFVLRRRVDGVERWLTVGRYPEMSLSQARQVAAQMKDIEEPKKILTFIELFDLYLNDGIKTGKWQREFQRNFTSCRQEVRARNRLVKYFPQSLLNSRADEVTKQQLAKALSPIYLDKPKTARGIQTDINLAFRWGISMDLIDKNPAEYYILSRLLPNKRAIPVPGHIPFLTPTEVPRLVAALIKNGSFLARPIMFAILTGSRTSNALFATWDQVDLDKLTFTVPREKMKIKTASFDAVTPISRRVADLLTEWGRVNPDSELLFPSPNKTKCGQIYEQKLYRYLDNLDAADVAAGGIGFKDPISGRVCRPHGIARASFTTWAKAPAKYSHSIFDDDMIEACLDHFNPKYGGAYFREIPVEDMRPIMDEWADFCLSQVGST